MEAGESTATPAPPPAVDKPVATPSTDPPPLPLEARDEKPAPEETLAPTAGTPEVPPPGTNLEVTLGGKVASFIGIAALVLGIVFFVGYAIQHGWIGPAMRILLGLICGGVLIALGHLAEVKSTSLQVLARVLTGGGSALMFFSVFAAHGIYDLIGPWSAAAGLVATAAIVMGLSVLYRSQTVAILGVLGAFITPLTIGGEFNDGVFPLAYIAAVNASVMLLGVRRNWQSLYNIAFVFTVGYSGLWIDREIMVIGSGQPWIVGLCFVCLYFVEFIVLGLAKLKGERGALDQVVDMGRMLLGSLLLMAALYGILNAHDFNAWIGAVFLVAALVHLVLVKLAWRWLPRFKGDILVLIAGALTFATLALPAQLDGVWVSLGWAIGGLLLAWFAQRYTVGAFLIGGIALGLLGLWKSLVYDQQFYDRELVKLFFNSRFIVALLSAGMLGAQAWLWGRRDEAEAEHKPALHLLEALIIIIAALGFIVAVGSDSFFVLRDASWAWMSLGVAILLAGAFVMVLANRSNSYPLWLFGVLLLAILPVEALFIVVSHEYRFEFPNGVFFTALLLVAGTFFLASRLVESEARPSGIKVKVGLYITSLLSFILVVSREIALTHTPWKDTAITLWWASCALILIFLGLRMAQRYLRITGLALFGFTIGKVFLFDLSELDDLVRVAAFMGVGIILLVLSFTYQRIAPRLAAPPPPAKEEGDHEV